MHFALAVIRGVRELVPMILIEVKHMYLELVNIIGVNDNWGIDNWGIDLRISLLIVESP